MQEFVQYDPRNPIPEQHLLKIFKSPQKENGKSFYFVKQQGHLLIYSERLHIYPATSKHYGQQELIANQFEMPLDAIRWIIDVIEKKFFKSPEEGGLAASEISEETIVAGENLHIIRSANAGGPFPGYDITNASRRSHLDSENFQTFSISDLWLFENGLMSYLKFLAEDYEKRQL